MKTKQTSQRASWSIMMLDDIFILITQTKATTTEHI